MPKTTISENETALDQNVEFEGCEGGVATRSKSEERRERREAGSSWQVQGYML